MLNNHNKVLIEAYNKGYRVVNCCVISPFSNKKLKLHIKKCGYYKFCCAALGNKRYTVEVHRLVAYQKYGDVIFQDGIQVRHLNGNGLDNSEDNISIGTQSDNRLDIPENIRLSSAITASNKIRKFTDLEVVEIKRDRYINKFTYKELMEKYNITSKGTLSYMLNNEYVTTKN